MPESNANPSDSAVGPSTRPQRVFLSYGHDEHCRTVQDIKSLLEERGHEAWFDTERLLPGDQWSKRIEEALDWCDQVLLFMSPHSVRRRSASDPDSKDGFCLNELARALDKKKTVIPILIAPLEDGPPLSIYNLQYLDLSLHLLGDSSVRTLRQCADPLFQRIEDPSATLDGEWGDLIAKLAPKSTESFLARPAHFVGRKWLLKKLDDWLLNPTGQQIMGLSAPAGFGKSALAAYLAEARSEVIAYHRCVFEHQDLSDPQVVLLSIVSQIARYIPSYRKQLTRLSLGDYRNKNASTIFDDLILTPLSTRSISPPTSAKMVVIDGLDEAVASGRGELTDILSRKWKSLPGWLRLMVTTRPEPEIMISFNNTTFIDLRGSYNDSDLEEYIKDCLDDRGISVPARTIAHVAKSCEGMFLRATLAMDALSEGNLRLDEVSGFLQGMGSSYMKWFSRRFPDTSAYSTVLAPVIEIIIAQCAPIPTELVRGAAGIHDELAFNKIVSELGSLFPLRDSGGDSSSTLVAPCHRDLAEWLTAEDPKTHTKKAGKYAANYFKGHKALAALGLSASRPRTTAADQYFERYLPHHLIETQQIDLALEFLSDPQNLQRAAARYGQSEWMRYWRRLEGENPARAYRASLLALEEQQGVNRLLATLYDIVGDFLRDHGALSEAIPFLDRAGAILEDLPEVEEAELAHNASALAKIYMEQGDRDRSLTLHMKALDHFERDKGDSSLEAGIEHHALSLLLWKMGRARDALRHNTRAIVLLEHFRPESHLRLADALVDMGVMLDGTVGGSGSLVFYNRAADLLEQSHYRDHPILAYCLHNAALAESADPRAIALMEQALSIFENTFHPYHADVLQCRRNLAFRYFRVGKLDRAVSLLSDNEAVPSADDVRHIVRDTVLSISQLKQAQDSMCASLGEICKAVDASEDLPQPHDEGLRAILRKVSLRFCGSDGPLSKGGQWVSGDSGSSWDMTWHSASELEDLLIQFAKQLSEKGDAADACELYSLVAEARTTRSGGTDASIDLLVGVSNCHLAAGNARASLGSIGRCLWRMRSQTPRPIQSMMGLLISAGSLAVDHKQHRRGLSSFRLAGRLALDAPDETDRTKWAQIVASHVHSRALALKNKHAAFSEAGEFYRLAIQLDPDDAIILGNYALFLAGVRGHHEEAETYYQKALSGNPDDAVLTSNFAFFLQSGLRDHERAKELYDRAFELDPDDSNHHALFSSFLMEQGSMEAAETHLRRSWELMKDKSDRLAFRPLFLMALLFQLSGKSPEVFLGQLKILFMANVPRVPWTPPDFLGTLDKSLAGPKGAFWRTLLEATCRSSGDAQLDGISKWRSLPPVPLTEPWPSLRAD